LKKNPNSLLAKLVRKTFTHVIEVNWLNHCVVTITQTNEQLTNFRFLYSIHFDSPRECFIKPTFIRYEKTLFRFWMV